MSLKALGVIPARGGSKRLPRKNLRQLGGKPLIAYTIEAALKSNCFEQLILSSDDEEILSVANDYTGIIPDRRSDHLAGDYVKVWDVVGEIVDRDTFQGQFDVIGLMLPTCPFKWASDIQAGFDRLVPDIDSVISLADYDFPTHFQVTFQEESDRLNMSEHLRSGNTRSQDVQPTYHPNGAYYLSWWQSFTKYRSFFNGEISGYVMPPLRSVDIDDEFDFAYAQYLLDTRAEQLHEKGN